MHYATRQSGDSGPFSVSPLPISLTGSSSNDHANFALDMDPAIGLSSMFPMEVLPNDDDFFRNQKLKVQGPGMHISIVAFPFADTVF